MDLKIRTLPDDLKLACKDPRIRLIVDIALSTALRKSEILSLKRDNIAEAHEVRQIIVVRVKGGHYREVYLPDGLRQAIKEFIERDRLGWRGPLFRGIQKEFEGQMARSTLEYLWKRAQKDSGIVLPYRFHCLRHTAITRFWEQSRDLLLTAQFAGHTNPKITMQYTHPKPQEVWRTQDAIDQKERSQNVLSMGGRMDTDRDHSHKQPDPGEKSQSEEPTT